MLGPGKEASTLLGNIKSEMPPVLQVSGNGKKALDKRSLETRGLMEPDRRIKTVIMVCEPRKWHALPLPSSSTLMEPQRLYGKHGGAG